jgi:hypothetical protein
VGGGAGSSSDESGGEQRRSDTQPPQAENRPMLHMWFTCKVCNTRSYRSFTRHAYETGVVIVQCGGCNKYHLIADNQGRFGAQWNLEDYLRAQGRGDALRRSGLGQTFELSEEDMRNYVAWQKQNAALRAAAAERKRVFQATGQLPEEEAGAAAATQVTGENDSDARGGGGRA